MQPVDLGTLDEACLASVESARIEGSRSWVVTELEQAQEPYRRSLAWLVVGHLEVSDLETGVHLVQKVDPVMAFCHLHDLEEVLTSLVVDPAYVVVVP